MYIYYNMELNDFEIYRGKSFSSLCKEIIVNQNEKKDQLDILISELRSLIKTTTDAMIIVPLIKEYFEVGVRNDEQLVKLAAIIQKIMTRQQDSSEDGNSLSITEEERKQLLEEVDKLKNVSILKIKDTK